MSDFYQKEAEKSEWIREGIRRGEVKFDEFIEKLQVLIGYSLGIEGVEVDLNVLASLEKEINKLAEEYKNK